jgi:hypothetical protein
MSSLASSELYITPNALAKELDWRLNEVADHLPEQVKLAGSAIDPHEIKTLYAAQGVGKLLGMFLGRQDDGFQVRLAIVPEGYEGNSGICKDYDLLDYHISKSGVPHQVEPTQPEDFVGCPMALNEVAFLVQTLHEGYMQGVVQSGTNTGNVISIVDRLQYQ